VGRFVRVCSTYLAGDLVPGNNVYRDSVTVIKGTGISEDAGKGARPAQSALRDVQPNPAREQVHIDYALAVDGFNRIAIYDAQGRLVQEIIAASQAPGRYSVAWDCRDASGRSVAPGVYFCRMFAGRFRTTTKLLLMP
jgi:hypothetical protein